MIRMLTALVVGVALLGVTISANAADTKPVTLKGDITCGKCDLDVDSACATVIKVGETVYYFDKKSHGKYHKDTCQAAKAGEVTGVVSEKDGKKIITVTKLTYK